MKELQEISTLPPKDASKEVCKEGLKAYREKLFELQNMFYANGNHGLLVILQGTDTSGKDSTIRHVMTCMNPQGVRVQSFKKPTEEELKHDFLWRIYPHIPGKGYIQVFNRSYYEDMIVPMTEQSLPEAIIKERGAFINGLEQHLMQSNIHILKFFLHISPEKQKEKIEERLLKPHKRWKYSHDDAKTNREWTAGMKAYNLLLKQCKEPAWHIIPSDKKWYRNYMVAKVLTEYMEGLNLQYPTG